jgi:hypothetical protein
VLSKRQVSECGSLHDGLGTKLHALIDIGVSS